ncbi:general stress protein [Priestia megaterium]|uniref:general stress protein n=1 Tax=Priestia megaterium TaxID=1404 RepID=UPI0023DC1487|nr:general stress protein [Priestia megaterium]MDF2058448.1 general stress protein [Priestia megaterium]MDF2064661.1 general stress protein [Priestia megaterium]
MYETPEETLNTIEKLRTIGYEDKEITVLTNQETTAGNLAYRTNVNVDQLSSINHDEITHEDMTGGAQPDSFFDKLKKFFVVQNYSNDADPVTELGIPSEELTSYKKDLDDGKFVIAVTSHKLSEKGLDL